MFYLKRKMFYKHSYMKNSLFLPIIFFIIIFSNQAFSQDDLSEELKQDLADLSSAFVFVEPIEIGKVLRVKKGKGFAGDEKLKKRNKVKTGTVYSTMAGGTMALMLDEKTRIFIGEDTKIRIKEFSIVEPKSHKVTIELNKGSFSYKSLPKTTTDLEVQLKPDIGKEFREWSKKYLDESRCTDCPQYEARLMACAGNPFNSYLWCQDELDRLIYSKFPTMDSFGTDTNVGFSLTLPEDDYSLRFVNAGASNLKFQDEILGLGDYGVTNNINEVALTANGTPADFVGYTNFNNINNQFGDNLIGMGLDDYSPTTTGKKPTTNNSGGGGGGGGGGGDGGGGGCG